MAIVGPSGNQVPVQMRHHIPQLSHIYFAWKQYISLYLFDLPDNGHEFVTLVCLQLRHFADVIPPYNAREARVRRIVDINDPEVGVMPQDGPTWVLA
jgi:hypothetical protein